MKELIKIDKDEIDEFKKEGKNAYIIYLNVHHINGDKGDNNFKNLISLCPACHRHADKELKKIIRLSGEKYVSNDFLKQPI